MIKKEVLEIVFAIMIVFPIMFLISRFQWDPNFKIYREETLPYNRDPEKAKIHNIEAEKNITIVYSTCIPSIIIGILGLFVFVPKFYI
jgi:hypothetical protein